MTKQKIFVIPDTQIKPTTEDLSWLTAIGKEILAQKPDVIVHLGDHWDFPSLSSFSSAREIEGVRVKQDIDCGHEAMNVLLAPLRALQKAQKAHKKRIYRPRMVFTMGNHENRLNRYIDKNPALIGIMPDIKEMVESHGFEFYPFLEPVTIGGVSFAHYFYNPMSGRPYGGQCANKLNHIATSFVMGHQQGFQYAEKIIPTGGRIQGLVIGSSYIEEENYIGPQANHHWRGVAVLDDTENGTYNMNIMSTQRLMERHL